MGGGPHMKIETFESRRPFKAVSAVKKPSRSVTTR